MYYHFPFPHHQTPTDQGRDDLDWSSSFGNYSRRFPPLTPSATRNVLPLPLSTPPNTHRRRTWWPRFKFLLRKLRSSISTFCDKECITNSPFHTTKHGRVDLGWSSSFGNYSRRFPPITPHLNLFRRHFHTFTASSRQVHRPPRARATRQMLLPSSQPAAFTLIDDLCSHRSNKQLIRSP